MASGHPSPLLVQKAHITTLQARRRLMTASRARQGHIVLDRTSRSLRVFAMLAISATALQQHQISTNLRLERSAKKDIQRPSHACRASTTQSACRRSVDRAPGAFIVQPVGCLLTLHADLEHIVPKDPPSRNCAQRGLFPTSRNYRTALLVCPALLDATVRAMG